ncbi:MAG: hypothetical protein K9L79_15115 [Methylobacter tundripaludum]|nr:hypothetical protein [Methylobacter tundripaludum]
MAYRFLLNDRSIEENVPPDERLLDIIHRNRGLIGAKEACREGDWVLARYFGRAD